MATLFDQEAKGNLLIGSAQEEGRVIPLFAEDIDDELLLLARAVKVERGETDTAVDPELEGTESDGRILNMIMNGVERVTREGGPLDQMVEGAFGDPDAEMGGLIAGVGHKLRGDRQ